MTNISTSFQNIGQLNSAISALQGGPSLFLAKTLQQSVLSDYANAESATIVSQSNDELTLSFQNGDVLNVLGSNLSNSGASITEIDLNSPSAGATAAIHGFLQNHRSVLPA